MSALTRTESGPFSLEQACTVARLEELMPEERVKLLLPLEEFFGELPAVRLPDFYARLARNGCEIYQSKIHSGYEIGSLVRMYRADEFFALGRVQEYPAGSAVKAVKIFSL